MKEPYPITRRTAVKSSIFGLLFASFPSVLYAREFIKSTSLKKKESQTFHRYPAIEDEITAEVVGTSHFDLNRVMELVNNRPELSRATWDWGFGDWETALGAASHVGRRDIAEFLIEKGARPDIFTFAMLGSYKAVKTMIEAKPHIQTIYGPHGISLLQHAKAGLRTENLNEIQKSDNKKLISYLKELGDANPRQTHIALEPKEKEKYVGDYMYGDGPDDGFSIKLNMRKLLALGKIGKFGGAIYRQSDGVFEYNGVSSVKINFEEKEGYIVSLTVHEPNLNLKAVKV